MKLSKLKELLKTNAISQEEYDEMSKTAEDDIKNTPPNEDPDETLDVDPPKKEPDDDMEAKIAKAVQAAVDRATNRLGNENKLLKKKLEKTRKEKLSAEELKAVELQEKEAELARQQSEIQTEKNRMYAVKALKKAELDDGSEDALDLVEFVLGEDEAAIDLKVKALHSFAKRIEKRTMDGIYRENGRTPEKGNAGSGQENP